MRKNRRRHLRAVAGLAGGLALTAAVAGCGGGESVVAGGSAGVSGRQLVGLTMSLPAGATRTLSVKCPQGKSSLGGGFDTESPSVNVLSSTPFNAGNGWRVRARNAGSAAATIYINAVCAPVG